MVEATAHRSEWDSEKRAAQPPGKKTIKVIRCDRSRVTGDIELAVGREPWSQRKEAVGRGVERWGQRV